MYALEMKYRIARWKNYESNLRATQWFLVALFTCQRIPHHISCRRIDVIHPWKRDQQRRLVVTWWGKESLRLAGNTFLHFLALKISIVGKVYSSILPRESELRLHPKRASSAAAKKWKERQVLIPMWTVGLLRHRNLKDTTQQRGFPKRYDCYKCTNSDAYVTCITTSQPSPNEDAYVTKLWGSLGFANSQGVLFKESQPDEFAWSSHGKGPVVRPLGPLWLPLPLTKY